MSSQKTTQRLSLLAGSSLAAATIAAAFTGVALAPTAALAANECTPIGVDPSANPGPDSYECSTTPYATGITYDSDGDLTVTKTNTGTTTVTADGVNLMGNGDDTVTWDSTIGTVTGGAGTNGPVIDVTSGTGDINISTATVSGSSAGVTHGIRATSTGGGDITINRTSGSSFITGTGSEATIEAVTNGGDVDMSLSGTTSGRLRGIVAGTSGTGAITLDVAGSVSINSVAGIAAIDTVAATGATAINITSGTIGSTDLLAIRSVSASTSPTAAVNVQNTGGTVNGRVDFSGVTAGGVTFNNTGATATSGRWNARGTSVFSAQNDTVTLGGASVNLWASDAIVNFGAGNDTFNMGAFLETTGATLDFGAGSDTWNLSGSMAMDGLTVTGLETLNLSGTIFMGAGEVLSGCCTMVTGYENSDLAPDDVLALNGLDFVGAGGRVVMDAILGTETQPGCATLTGAGDCLDLRDSTTSGVTLVRVNYVGDDQRDGSYNPVGVTLVDVSGAGSSAAGHFVIDPNSDGYAEDPLLGGVISRPGLFGYTLRYDAENQRHALVGLPRLPVMEYAMLTGAAQSIWHLTADTVTDRHSDLRQRTAGGEVWLRAAGEYTKRDSDSALTIFGDTLSVDTSHKLYAGTIIGGMDLAAGTSGAYDYVAGVQIGYASSSFDLNASDTSGRFTGATGGLYGSIWNERMFLVGAFNMNGLTLDYDSPALGSKTNTYTTAFGARMDGGLRFALMDGVVAEPLATVAFVRTNFEEISLSGGEIEPGDNESRRGALGLRVAGTLGGGESLGATYFVTGRAWQEFDGDAEGAVANAGGDLLFMDEFSGTFGEAEAGVNLFNAAGTLSGFLTSGVKWKDGYSAVDLSLGLRMAW